jgi:hypothetical protein
MTEDYILYLTLNGYLTFQTLITKDAFLDNDLKTKSVLYVPTIAMRGCLTTVEVVETPNPLFEVL